MNDDASASGLPQTDRLERLRDEALRAREPIEFRFGEASDLKLQLDLADFGPIMLISLTTAGRFSMALARTNRLVRQSDPESYRVLINLSGRTALSQERQDVILCPGEMALYDTSRPHHGWRTATGTAQLLMVIAPKTLVAPRPDKVRSLTATKLPHTGVGRLALTTFAQAARDAAEFGAADRARTSLAMMDMLDALLCRALNAPNHHRRVLDRETLLAQAQEFIERRLDDPRLSPALVAAAHHVAPRTLDRIFQASGLSVASWIRSQRLERCRRELINPANFGTPLSAIATRFGFTDASHFSRSFSAEFGVPPSAYRQAWLSSDRQSSGAISQ